MIVDLQIVVFTGILVAVFFVLNFVTCFAMPWAKECPFPHKCPGREKCPVHKKAMLCDYHAPIAWLTIITISIHIILATLYLI